MDPPATPRGSAPSDDLRALLDPAHFSRVHFGWTPHPYQRKVMDAVLLDGKRRVAWVAGRRVGKTDTIANVALQLALRKPGRRIATLAPTFNQATFLSKRVRFHLAGSPFQRRVAVDKVEELRLGFGRDDRGKPVESVVFTSSLSGNVRGDGADVLIVDESGFCDAEAYRTKVMPFVVDRPESIVIHISSPGDPDGHFSKVIEEYGRRTDGAVFRTRTAENPAVTPGALQELREAMSEAEFRRECECDTTAEGGVFDRRALAKCLRDYEVLDLAGLARLEPRPHATYAIGVDWAKKQDRAVVAAFEQGTQERVNPARLVFLHAYEPDPGSTDHYTRILRDVQRLAERVQAQRVVADEGEGGHQAEVLHRALGRRFVPYRFTVRSRNWLVENAMYHVEKGLVELPVEPDVVRQAFLNVERGEAGYVHGNRRLKDIFDAIALALSEAEPQQERKRAPMRILTVDRTYGLRMGLGRERKRSLREQLGIPDPRTL